MAKSKKERSQPAEAPVDATPAPAPAPKRAKGGKGGKKKRAPRGPNARRNEVERQEKIAEALDYRRQGYTYRQIAQAMEISTTSAHTYVTEGLRAIPEEAANDVRQMMMTRLDHLLSALTSEFEAAPVENLDLVDTILKIEERRLRMLGLDSGDGGMDAITDMAATMKAMMTADRPVLAPDAAIPANPIM